MVDDESESLRSTFAELEVPVKYPRPLFPQEEENINNGWRRLMRMPPSEAKKKAFLDLFRPVWGRNAIYAAQMEVAAPKASPPSVVADPVPEHTPQQQEKLSPPRLQFAPPIDAVEAAKNPALVTDWNRMNDTYVTLVAYAREHNHISADYAVSEFEKIKDGMQTDWGRKILGYMIDDLKKQREAEKRNQIEWKKKLRGVDKDGVAR